MAKGSIKLIRYTAEYEYDPDNRTGWGILVRAESLSDMDPEIFVYHRMRAGDPYTGDLFEAVASINQYYEIPAYAPAEISTDEIIPYYRRNQMEVFARSPSELEEIWKYMQIDVARLVRDFNSTDILTAVKESQISEIGSIQESEIATSSKVVELAWGPAGTWDGATITTPDSSLRGWLPIALAANTFADPQERIPENAVWFYNMGAETAAVQDSFAQVVPPYSKNFLDIDGVYLLYGENGAYQVTKDTVFWMPNSNYQVEMISENPWPDDYIQGLDTQKRVLRLTIPAESS